MPRALPAKPNLEHLKSQAKDLLDAHKRAEPEAFARIRAAVPAFASMSDAELARAAFALHDAQSAIAREYGFVSWAELRSKVTADEGAAGGEGAAASDDDPAVAILRATPGVPPELQAVLLEVLAQRGKQRDVPTPPTVPVLPVRNAVIFPGAQIPLDINRPSSMRAIEAARKTEPALLAVFAQRAPDIERPTRDDLHPTGSLCIVRVVRTGADIPPPQTVPPPAAPPPPSPAGPPRLAWMIVEGIRWVELQALEQIDPYHVARISDTIDSDDDASHMIAQLDQQVRELAHRFADTMTDVSAQVHAVIDQTTDPRQLADLVMANFPIPVADMASYAEETKLSGKLHRAIALLAEQLEKADRASR